MTAGIVAAAVFVGAMVALSIYLRRKDSEGNWDKEGHGSSDTEPGPKFRGLEVPPKEPFG
ncbi:MAG: hypothetical protein A2Z12_04815 [Actinobacteria bacterium RBG_16_68_21]|nr:MAG: hypothetical protein A2Z12_04815 [Actinobacteria bacterium RBG_16_68_21]